MFGPKDGLQIFNGSLPLVVHYPIIVTRGLVQFRSGVGETSLYDGLRVLFSMAKAFF